MMRMGANLVLFLVVGIPTVFCDSQNFGFIPDSTDFAEGFLSRNNRDQVDWQRIVPEEEEFSVAMPVPLRAYVHFRNLPSSLNIGGQQIRQYLTYNTFANGLVFIIHSFKTTKPEKVLQELMTNVRASAETEADLDIDGFQGKEFRIRRARYELHAYYVVAKEHAYVFLVAGRARTRMDAAPFLISVRLGTARELKQNVAARIGRFAVAKDPPKRKEPVSALKQSSGGSEDEVEVVGSKDLTLKPVIIWRPPAFDNGAIRGNVELRLVLGATGEVTDIVPVKKLKGGYTESAIDAARLIKFLPAEKDGQPVSVQVTIVYRFGRK